MIWQSKRFQIDLNTPKIMGIVNITPDSFSDGGQYSGSLKTALAHAEKLLQDGAAILDIGGESTRPNAPHVSPEEEWSRVAPILDEVSKWQVPISLDTRRTAIMQCALDKNAVDIINDVQGLEDVGAVDLLAQSDVGICVMHMKGLPENMQNNPNYQNVVDEVAQYLQQRADACIQAGIHKNRLMLDAGFGFGKNLAHNIALLQNLDKLSTSHHLPHLVGVSRKRMIGEMTGREIASERVSGSVAAALFAVEHGAKIVRVHDVRETADALKVWQQLSFRQPEIQIIHQNQRFEYQENGHTAYLSYVLRGDIRVFNHTIVPPELAGRGVGKKLAQHALDFAREHGWRIQISCDFIAAFVDKNPQYQDLLC